jgi:hypothetical protein
VRVRFNKRGLVDVEPTNPLKDVPGPESYFFFFAAFFLVAFFLAAFFFAILESPPRILGAKGGPQNAAGDTSCDRASRPSRPYLELPSAQGGLTGTVKQPSCHEPFRQHAITRNSMSKRVINILRYSRVAQFPVECVVEKQRNRQVS